MRVLSRAFLVGLLVLLVTVTGRAAGVAVQGAIVDPSGAVIPGATVELVSGGRIVSKAISASDGTFRFSDVAAGTYEIRVTLSGFRQSRLSITVGSSAPPVLRIKLLVGSTTESVAVAAAAPVVTDRLGPGAGGGVVGGVVGGLPIPQSAPP